MQHKIKTNAVLIIAMGLSVMVAHAALPRFTLWQLPSQGHKQMMSYVIQTEDGKVIVIDGGNTIDGPYLKDFLVARGNHVDSWFITHPHKDHSDALSWILANQGDLVIDEIYASFPPVEWMDQYYDPNAKSGEQAFTDAMANAGKSHVDLGVGDIMDIDEIQIEVLFIGDTNITHNAANNYSLVMLFSDPTKTVLFTSDIGPQGGDAVLAAVDHDKLYADYVQMAHHGQACAGENFWQVVQPDYCLWPTPLWLWNNDAGGGYNTGPYGTVTTRGWIEALGVKSNYVSGVVGLVEIK